MHRRDNPDYEPVIEHTIDVHSSTVLPRTNFNDPKAIDNIVKAIHQDKIGIDDMSTSINKMRLDPKIIIAMAIFIPIGLMLFYSGVISPAMQEQNKYNLELAKAGGDPSKVNMPPPPGFAEIIRLPGFNR